MNDSVSVRVVKMTQELLLDEVDSTGVTPALISEKIDLVLRMQPRWADGLDRDAVVDELIRRFSVWIGNDTTLVNNAGHEPWLDAARKSGWRYWQRYRELLEKNLPWKAVDAVDKSTDKILGMLEDPLRLGTWDRRGLVVGHVQSGKTANYIGLICKAADAQYKVIIVLAGLHNNLRSQTQIRLEEGFLGYETNTVGNVQPRIGVGLIDSDQSINPNCATTRANNGDFGGRAATQLAISPEERPWLFVVKKNKSVLVQLLKWIQNHVADMPLPPDAAAGPEDDRLPRVKKRSTKFPLLVIDDEADNASVDTGETVVDADGNPDEEHQPTTINRLIRRILHSFSRSAYVGYTATPFANIFIHERGETRAEGPDLFPAAFIQNLAAPSNYAGPQTVFGWAVPDGRTNQLPLIREVNDFMSADGSGWMPVKHKSWHVPAFPGPDGIPPSLRDALDSFVLACCARELRGQGRMHSSMLVHVTRYNHVQSAVHRQISEHVQGMRQRIGRRIGHEPILERLRELWDSDFLPVTREIRATALSDVPEHDADWNGIVAVLGDVVHDIDVRMINGTAKDILDYEENKSKGLRVIAIGGDKLARGLTLEGLCTSYFLRASRMYDTLMQMGRWFGYRPSYLDLCRLYTSPDLIRWFRHISDAAMELREEFDLMANSGATPREYGLKVQSHAELLVTSQVKMRSARTLKLSFSGQLMQTVSLPRALLTLQDNLRAASNLIGALGQTAEEDPERLFGSVRLQWSGYLWRSVSSSHIVDFLESYRTTGTAHRVDSARLAEFVQKMAVSGELTQWSVALLGLKTGRSCEVAPGVSVKMVTRTGDRQFEDRYAIGVLTDPKDESIDLDGARWKAALDLTASTWEKAGKSGRPEVPSGPAIRRVRGLGAPGVPARPEQGLLILYVLDPKEAGLDLAENTPGIVAFGLSFPASNSRVQVDYKVNNVAWELEYGASE